LYIGSKKEVDLASAILAGRKERAAAG
jgi:hypothetical protein